ncbi:hypothetical protein KCU92_g805, partial [Aureobasidium melanogenum]
MATNNIFDRLEAIFLAFNPPSQLDQSEHVWMRKDSLVIASRFVLAFNCKDGPDPVQAASTLTLPENQLAKEVWFMTAYLFQEPADHISYNAWTAKEAGPARAHWNAYVQKPALTLEDVASLAGALGSQWLTHLANCADDPLKASRQELHRPLVSLEALCLPWNSKERLKVLETHTEAALIHYHDLYRAWDPLSDTVKRDKSAIMWKILEKEKTAMRKLEKGYPVEAWVMEEGPSEPKTFLALTRISRFEEIYRLRDHLRNSRLFMGIRMDQELQRRWSPYAPRNWAYVGDLLRGNFDLLESDAESYQQAAAKLASNTTAMNKEPSSIPSHEATTVTTNKPTIASEDDTTLHIAISNRTWDVELVLDIYELKEQDPTKVSDYNTELARQAVHSIKLVHEKEGENGYGWDNPASATILRAVVQNDDDWLFQ